MSKWRELEGAYIVPGGDKVWICSVCKGQNSIHVYGTEHPKNHMHRCPTCGISLCYPWENDEQEDAPLTEEQEAQLNADFEAEMQRLQPELYQA